MMRRCREPYSTYPGVYCEEPNNHVERDGTPHFNSFYSRRWTDEDRVSDVRDASQDEGDAPLSL